MRTIKEHTRVKMGVEDGEVIRFVTDTKEEFVVCIHTRNSDGSRSQGGCAGCPLYDDIMDVPCPLSATGIFGGAYKGKYLGYILHTGRSLEDSVE